MVINIKELHFTSHYNSCNINQFLLNTKKIISQKGRTNYIVKYFLSMDKI